VALFLSTFVNKVDRKGRVSVPATFRAALAGQTFNGIVAFRSFKLPTIEGSGIDRIEEMSARLDGLEQFSEEYDNLASIFADAQQLPFDGEGRIVLPENLVEHAGLGEAAAFVGLGLGILFLAIGLNRPSIANMRTVDLVHLLGTGACLGAGLAAVIANLVRRPKSV